jgi:hypothetical protein
VGAIRTAEGQGLAVSEIDQDECVECGVCERAQVCPVDAIERSDLSWPRVIRAQFSDPLTPHPSKKEGGRGTEEMKTNDVTGRFRRGKTGVVIEMGRPGLGTRLAEIETMTMALARLGVEFERQNPLTALIVDRSSGKIHDEVLAKKVLSAIIEFNIENDRLKEVLRSIKALAPRLKTVFSLGLISPVERDGSLPFVPIATRAGFSIRPNGKINVGLGRPLKEV